MREDDVCGNPSLMNNNLFGTGSAKTSPLTNYNIFDTDSTKTSSLTNDNLFGTDGIRNKVGNEPFTLIQLPRLGAAIALWAHKKYNPNNMHTESDHTNTESNEIHTESSYTQ